MAGRKDITQTIRRDKARKRLHFFVNKRFILYCATQSMFVCKIATEVEFCLNIEAVSEITIGKNV